MTDREALRECPFCGRGEGSVEIHRINYNGAMVYCKHCGVSGPTFGAAGYFGFDREEHETHVTAAIRRWNARTTLSLPAPSDARERALEEALQDIIRTHANDGIRPKAFYIAARALHPAEHPTNEQKGSQ